MGTKGGCTDFYALYAEASKEAMRLVEEGTRTNPIIGREVAKKYATMGRFKDQFVQVGGWVFDGLRVVGGDERER